MSSQSLSLTGEEMRWSPARRPNRTPPGWGSCDRSARSTYGVVECGNLYRFRVCLFGVQTLPCQNFGSHTLCGHRLLCCRTCGVLNLALWFRCFLPQLWPVTLAMWLITTANQTDPQWHSLVVCIIVHALRVQCSAHESWSCASVFWAVRYIWHPSILVCCILGLQMFNGCAYSFTLRLIPNS